MKRQRGIISSGVMCQTQPAQAHATCFPLPTTRHACRTEDQTEAEDAEETEDADAVVAGAEAALAPLIRAHMEEAASTATEGEAVVGMTAVDTTVDVVVSTVAVEDSIVAVEDSTVDGVAEEAEEALRGILEGESYHHATSSLTLTKNGHSIFAEGQPANVDTRLTDTSQDDIIRALGGLRINDNDLPVRKGYGTIGTPIKLRANFFPVRVPKGPLYEYDVAVDPPVSVKRVKRRIFHLAEGTADWANAGMRGTVAHDLSAKLIASKKLPQPLVIRVTYTDEDGGPPTEAPQPQGKGKGGKGKGGGKKEASPQEYTLTIKFIQELETQSLVRCVDCLPFPIDCENVPSILGNASAIVHDSSTHTLGDGTAHQYSSAATLMMTGWVVPTSTRTGI